MNNTINRSSYLSSSYHPLEDHPIKQTKKTYSVVTFFGTLFPKFELLLVKLLILRLF